MTIWSWVCAYIWKRRTEWGNGQSYQNVWYNSYQNVCSKYNSFGSSTIFRASERYTCVYFPFLGQSKEFLYLNLFNDVLWVWVPFSGLWNELHLSNATNSYANIHNIYSYAVNKVRIVSIWLTHLVFQVFLPFWFICMSFSSH